MRRGLILPICYTAMDYSFVQPGLRWDDVQVQVAQMGDGDFQSASVLGGNLVLRPTAELPVSDIITGISLILTEW